MTGTNLPKKKSTSKISRRHLMDAFAEQAQELYLSVLQIVRNPDDTQDIMAEVFLKLATMAIEQLPRDNVKAWLRTVARNMALNHLKRAEFCLPVEWIDDVPSTSSLEDAVQSSIDFEILLSSLDEISRKIVAEKIRNQLTHKEIAIMLNLPEGTVRRKYREALKLLKKLSGQ